MKEQDKIIAIIARDLSKMEIICLIGNLMIIKILTGLEKRVEDISETLNKEIKNNISEMKNSINEIKNTLGGINGRLQEAEDCIRDLEDRVIESNRMTNKYCRIRIDLGNSVTPASIITFALQGSKKEKREKGKQKMYLKK